MLRRGNIVKLKRRKNKKVLDAREGKEDEIYIDCCQRNFIVFLYIYIRTIPYVYIKRKEKLLLWINFFFMNISRRSINVHIKMQ